MAALLILLEAIMLMGYCDSRAYMIHYTTGFLTQIQLDVQLQNSTTEVCVTYIEDLKVEQQSKILCEQQK